MDVAAILRDFAFSKYESSCYLALLAKHPANGSQLSKLSGIARSRIYDVLRSLTNKKVIFEIEKGLYVPLPFEELKKRLRGQFEFIRRRNRRHHRQRDFIVRIRLCRSEQQRTIDRRDGAVTTRIRRHESIVQSAPDGIEQPDGHAESRRRTGLFHRRSHRQGRNEQRAGPYVYRIAGALRTRGAGHGGDSPDITELGSDADD